MALARGSFYVALGSSFAAGPGLRPRAAGSTRLSGRSSINYAHLLAARLGLDLEDVTYSGATTGDILDTSPTHRSGQIASVTSSTALVTVTAGGNDIGYLPGLTLSSLPGPLRSLPSARRRVATATDASTRDARFRALETSLTSLVHGIRDRAPAARIVLVGYLTILPPEHAGRALPGERLPPLTAGMISWGRDVAERLTTITRAVTVAERCDFVDAAAASRMHHAWSPEPWTRRFHLGLRGGAPYHPTSAGMRGVADLLADLLIGPRGRNDRE